MTMIQGLYLASEEIIDNKYTTRENKMRKGKDDGGDSRSASCNIWKHDNDNRIKLEFETTRMAEET